jgi:hypothetical protein
MESDDWQPLIDHLADDVVFKATIPDGTPISRELRGKQAKVDHLIAAAATSSTSRTC